MAEHVIGMMLVLSRHLDYFLKEQQQAHWSRDTPRLDDLEARRCWWWDWAVSRARSRVSGG
jgi:phosphoglycerate dehydrogenase-like enzyme